MTDGPDASDRVDIISTQDERLKTIGGILSSDSSRGMLQLLFNRSLTANQIAQKTGMSLPLAIHHLKKMQSVGIVRISHVGKNTKSHDVKFYTIDKVALVILPSEMMTPARSSKSLFDAFGRIHRLATLGAASVAAWFSAQLIGTLSAPSGTHTGPAAPETAVPQAGEAIPDGAADPAVTEALVRASSDSTSEAASAPGTAGPAAQTADEAAQGGAEKITGADSGGIAPEIAGGADAAAQSAAAEPLAGMLWSVLAVAGTAAAWLLVELYITRRGGR